jgi:hypothetical protein
LRRQERSSFSDSIPDAIILGKNDPATATDLSEPNFVSCVGSKVVVVNLDGFADVPQRLGYDFSTKGTVDEED